MENIPSPLLLNLMGALALALTDEMRTATEAKSALAAGAPSALTTITAFPGKSLDALRRILGLTPSGAGRLVDRLVEAGLVERRPGPSDQRFIALYPTKRGTKVADRILASRRATLSRTLSSLTSRERTSLEQILYKMLYAMASDRKEDHEQICRLCEISVCPQDICPVETAAQARKM